jgi:hypothetical protein
VGSLLNYFFFLVAFLALAFALILQLLPDMLSDKLFLKRSLIALSFLAGLASVLFGFNVKGITTKLQNWVIEKIETYFHRESG